MSSSSESVVLIASHDATVGAMMSMAHLRHHICLAMRKARGSVLGTGLGDGKTGRQGTGYSKNEEKRIQSRYPLTTIGYPPYLRNFHTAPWYRCAGSRKQSSRGNRVHDCAAECLCPCSVVCNYEF